MKLLLDTHIVLAIINDTVSALPKDIASLLSAPENTMTCSVASQLEIAIKSRLGKLYISCGLDELQPTCIKFGMAIMDITAAHVLAELADPPATRDPFDRLLLAQAQVETMRLVTIDKSMAGHPLAWAPVAG